ncbi:hypothetical protein FSARC_4258 [Fusarium sarcochroum]|uniref:Uncharacterized protein n=1 Tax=Fusarium sarcochroum TaxID=1208366 RepID=A0A8H4XAT4_9HYPO|nr:hypothetical protein FSARC_4258 [Fusarium sarcochroum]
MSLSLASHYSSTVQILILFLLTGKYQDLTLHPSWEAQDAGNPDFQRAVDVYQLSIDLEFSSLTDLVAKQLPIIGKSMTFTDIMDTLIENGHLLQDKDHDHLANFVVDRALVFEKGEEDEDLGSIHNCHKGCGRVPDILLHGIRIKNLLGKKAKKAK